MPADVIVLGAGMGGVSVALHPQRRGRDVILIVRRGAGEETSYGNSGLIQHEGVIPYTFPREFGAILSYAMNNRRDAVYLSLIGAAAHRAVAVSLLAECGAGAL
jgi:D-amino-acid dehydrogenase